MVLPLHHSRLHLLLIRRYFWVSGLPEILTLWKLAAAVRSLATRDR